MKNQQVILKSLRPSNDEDEKQLLVESLKIDLNQSSVISNQENSKMKANIEIQNQFDGLNKSEEQGHRSPQDLHIQNLDLFEK